MLLFNYSKKVKIILAGILVLFIFSVVIVIIFDRSRTKDLEAVEQVQIFATALENYYDRFQAYPIAKELNLATITQLTENGLNQAGGMIYYQATEDFSRPVYFLSSANSYTLKFSLKNSWPLWGLEFWRGGECRLTNNLDISCL